MDISDWRKKIDELDCKLAALLNERAAAAVAIGRLKRNTSLPIYGQIYERIMDVMRSIQKHEIVPDENAVAKVAENDSRRKR